MSAVEPSVNVSPNASLPPQSSVLKGFIPLNTNPLTSHPHKTLCVQITLGKHDKINTYLVFIFASIHVFLLVC